MGASLITYYKLMWPQDGPGGIAYAPEPFKLWLNPGETYLETWEEPTFLLRDGPFTDYLPNDVGVPLCSSKMRAIIDSGKHPSDLIEWLPVTVRDDNYTDQLFNPDTLDLLPVGNAEIREQTYHILHLLEELDVVDLSRSIVAATDFVVKPHLILEKVGDHQILRYKGSGSGMAICVSNRLRLTLIELGSTGCSFWRIPAT